MWPNGRQPEALESWKRDAAREPVPCWKTRVLEDLAGGWPGQCTGLVQDPASTDDAKCQAACMKSSICSVWEFIPESGCWIGRAPGFCLQTQPPLHVAAAQRLQHGDIRVVKDLTGYQIANLVNIGSLNVDGPEHCQRVCYSDLACEYWLYGPQGCWVQDPATSAVQYPLTLSLGGATVDSAFAASVVAGEYIQHVCPENVDQAARSVANAGDRAETQQQPADSSDEPLGEQMAVWQLAPYLVAGGLFLALLSCLFCVACDAMLRTGDREACEREDTALKEALTESRFTPLPLDSRSDRSSASSSESENEDSANTASMSSLGSS